ncbi:hypothetical protein [Chitinophaga sp. CB10]|uniref:hypothetical protein n=1 Tax=Chitinophaga sp. CB10 TaxID=1891659 RepID=UPI0025BB349B|nr:hypothetical protein [Chitinophaga sp. CB10]
MKTYYLMAALLPTFFACHSPAPPKQERTVQIDTMELVAPPASPATRVASNEVSVANTDSTTYIRFGSSYLSLDWLLPTPDQNDFELRPDTIYLTLKHPHSLEGQMLTFTSPGNAKIHVSQRYETSAVIEGNPLHVLRNWRHFKSDWEPLIPEADNFFICKKYTREQRTQFPVTSALELQQYVFRHLGKDIYSKIAAISSFPQAPCKVAITRYYLKVTGMLQHSSENINKLLVIDVAFK